MLGDVFLGLFIDTVEGIIGLVLVRMYVLDRYGRSHRIHFAWFFKSARIDLNKSRDGEMVR